MLIKQPFSGNGFPERKRWHSASKNCRVFPRTMCIKCDIGLCTECFVPLPTNDVDKNNVSIHRFIDATYFTCV